MISKYSTEKKYKGQNNLKCLITTTKYSIWDTTAEAVYVPINNIPRNATQLCCNRLHIRQLPNALPFKLNMINCNMNKITQLPDNLPVTLKELSCIGNELRKLPTKLPQGLLILNCGRNPLITLPKLPDGLLHLSVEYCPSLLILPELPETLRTFNISGNFFTELPDLPKTLVNFIYNNIRNKGNNILFERYPMLVQLYIDYDIRAIIQHVNEVNSRRRSQARNALLHQQIIEVYAVKTMHPRHLLPLIDNPDTDVDLFMAAHVARL